MKKVKKLVASVGTYTDRQGQEKTRYQTMGSMFKREDGSFCLKLDSIPVGGEFNGWVNVYDLDDEQQERKAPPPAPAPDDGDIIPF